MLLVIMKTFLTILLLFFSSSVIAAEDYSLFYEKDGGAIMVIGYEDEYTWGQIFEFSGYKWFKNTYSNSYEETKSFIQPSNLGVSGDTKSWMLTRYEIDGLVYVFYETKYNQILDFTSEQGGAVQTIIGYMSRNESFSFATLAKDAWYAGTFIPVKSIGDLIALSKINERTFCYVFEIEESIGGKNIQFRGDKLSNLMSLNGFVCDEKFNLLQ